MHLTVELYLFNEYCIILNLLCVRKTFIFFLSFRKLNSEVCFCCSSVADEKFRNFTGFGKQEI